MTDQKLIDAFAHALKAVAALPEEEEREHFRSLMSEGLLSFLTAVEEYALGKARMELIQRNLYNKNPN